MKHMRLFGSWGGETPAPELGRARIYLSCETCGMIRLLTSAFNRTTASPSCSLPHTLPLRSLPSATTALPPSIWVVTSRVSELRPYRDAPRVKYWTGTRIDISQPAVSGRITSPRYQALCSCAMRPMLSVSPSPRLSWMPFWPWRT